MSISGISAPSAAAYIPSRRATQPGHHAVHYFRRCGTDRLHNADRSGPAGSTGSTLRAGSPPSPSWRRRYFGTVLRRDPIRNEHCGEYSEYLV